MELRCLIMVISICTCACNGGSKKATGGSDDLAVKHAEPPVPAPQLPPPECKQPVVETEGGGDHPCGTKCTSNSPVVNAFPINGLAISGLGVCNPEGVNVLRHSLATTACGANLNLGYDSGKLVGKHDDGSVACRDLKGATFVARGWKSDSDPVTLTIAEVKPLDLEGNKNPPEGYLIKHGDHTLCDMKSANRVRKKLGIDELPEYDVPSNNDPVTANHDLVIAIDGPIYDYKVAPKDDTNTLFNLACADDALAKRSLTSLYSGAPADRGQDLAALRMITATYCSQPYTAHGMQFHWITTRAAKVIVKEAGWLNDKLTCFGKPRLANLTTTTPDQLPDELQPKGCAGKTCTTWDVWAAKVREECPTLDDCDKDDVGYQFESSTESDNARNMHYKHKHEDPAKPSKK